MSASAKHKDPSAAKPDGGSTVRRDTMRLVEKKAQERWAKEKTYEAEPVEGQEKYFVTFPYPYMNGRLHLGHAFSFSKSEFAARYQRLKGKNVLWPFGLHVTGTPIAACAQKLTNEIAKYGNPPVFPDEEEAAPAKKEEDADTAAAKTGQHKGRRAKVGPANKKQWEIMEAMGIAKDDIPKFADARHWLDFFPELALEDLQKFGAHIDYRRSFITTDENPYYDSFVRWQFTHLRKQDRLAWGKRYSVYSPLDGQPCADHDRATGEGVPPQEYTAVLLRVKTPLEQPCLKPHAAAIGTKPVVLPGATLRPETTIGQTNCWISPNVTYKAFEVVAPGSEAPAIYIMTAQAARNMAFQNFTVNGKKEHAPEAIFSVEGSALMGIPLAAPHAPYDTIYTLPMASISEKKGTGVVMSVPSDSPDDFTNFKALADKPDYRAKLGLKDEWVMPFASPPAIIDCGGDLGVTAAKSACEQCKVAGPKDAENLDAAKKIAYAAGFYQGVMVHGPFKDEKVSIAKVRMAKKMVDEGDAIVYYEPQKPVMSRSGDECVVALCDQWFLKYSDEEWEAAVAKHLTSMETYFPGIRNGLEEVVKWLSEWPCSRNFGLGTNLPFEDSQKVIIDSLSDSTIYMAYYMAAKYVHAAKDGSLNLDGTKENKYGLKPSMFTFDTWEFVLRGGGDAKSLEAKTGLPAAIAESMRKDFLYFYPVDLRVSGKDLIQNHLTMFLYNHAAIWHDDPSKWPRAIYCNGHVQVDGAKMSKSAGNFIILEDALKEYTADGTRLALADAGDSLDDANFVRDTAMGFTLKLTTLIDLFKDRHSKLDQMRTGDKTMFDRIFENSINDAVERVDSLYNKMCFRLAFNMIFYEMQSDESQYRIACGDAGVHKECMTRFMEVFPVLLSPLAPHTAEFLWTEVLQKPESIMKERFPKQTAAVDVSLHFAAKLINEVSHDIRAQATKLKEKKKMAALPTDAIVYVATDYLPWQKSGLQSLKAVADANNGELSKDGIKGIMKESWVDKKNMQDIMAFISYSKGIAEKHGLGALATTPVIDDMKVLSETLAHLKAHTGVANITLRRRDDADAPAEHKVTREKARPGAPTVGFPMSK